MFSIISIGINIMMICQIVGICNDKIGTFIWRLDGSYCSTQISQSDCIEIYRISEYGVRGCTS